MDFLQDRTADGRPFRMLVVLYELTVLRGSSKHIRSDNGPEMISKAVKAWCKERYRSAQHRSGITPAEWHRGDPQKLDA